MNAISLMGLSVVLAVFVAYLAMLFLLHRFTYRTWIFHAAVIAGMTLAVLGAALGANPLVSVVVVAVGLAWFVITRRELGISGSRTLTLRLGDPMPAFRALTTDGRAVTERELTQAAPVVVVLYRGWWCPSSKVQLDDMRSHYAELSALGLRVFAGSVDGPEEAAPMQEYVGSDMTILCDVDVSFLDAIGVRDQRGAPWYDRLWFGAARQPIAMPAVIALGPDGRVTYAERSTRVDDRPSATALMAGLRPTASQLAASSEKAADLPRPFLECRC
jgi:peroxiredoxin